MTTMTAEKNVRVQEREERRKRVLDEQARLDRAKAARDNEERHRQIGVLRAQRVAAMVAAGSVAEFNVPDGDMLYRVRVTLSHEEVVARQAARALLIAMTHLMAAIESERIEAARQDAPGPNIGARLTLILDGDSGRLAARFNVMTAEMRKGK